MNRMWQFNTERSPGICVGGEREKLVSLISGVAQPDAIYLLGTVIHQLKIKSIFCTHMQDCQQFSEYWLLVLISAMNQKTLPQLQDQMEQRCSTEIPVTIIVLETDVFNKWLASGHLFARNVSRLAIPLFVTENLSLLPVGDYDPVAEQKVLEKQFQDGLNKSKEFLAGAELFRIRRQPKLAAFMLHQAAEQALGTLLKIGTGYYCCSHNLERLLRYAGMLSYQFLELFPRKTDQEKRLFSLLQKAYIDSRYREEYYISTAEILELTEKVRRIQEILTECAQAIFKKQEPV